MKKEYTKGDFVVGWEARKCIHSENCVNGLPEVFRPGEKPWIQVDNADISRIKATIDKCPSGALSYRLSGEEPESNKEQQSNATMKKVTVTKNGPLMVEGPVQIVKPDGATEEKTANVALCRCGASSNKPYCDGTHKKIGFEG